MLTKEEKLNLISAWSQGKGAGSTSVQIALLSTNISKLTEHLQTHRKDFHTRYGLIQQLNKRKSLLKYLKKENSDIFYKITQHFAIRVS